jgi:HD-GYP domain-containing protein (c-di-GMP phosphodiesterase class II)
VHDSIYHFTNRTYEQDCIDFKAYGIANLFEFEAKDKARFIIASHLINIGYFFMPLEIVNKKDILHHTEYQILKQVPYYTNYILQQIYGFSDIANLCYFVYEKINASGYPNKLSGSSLSLKHRALGIINMYQAMSEDRSYRDKLSKEEIFSILENDANNNFIDISVVNSLKKIL